MSAQPTPATPDHLTPAWDLVLFLVGSLGIDDRRGAETELLER
jgi:hypothetical protein